MSDREQSSPAAAAAQTSPADSCTSTIERIEIAPSPLTDSIPDTNGDAHFLAEYRLADYPSHRFFTVYSRFQTALCLV